jgi:hypothetical protein
MGHQPLPPAPAMRWRDYASHPDPATATGNLIALVLAGNTPFYPIYILALIGWHNTGVWLTALSTPFFLAIPALARHPALGRTALPLVGIINTVWCTALLGAQSAVPLFLLPCIIVSTLLFRERVVLLLMLGLAIAALILLRTFPLHSLLGLSPEQSGALATLNTFSVATLSGFLALSLAALLRDHSPPRR